MKKQVTLCMIIRDNKVLLGLKKRGFGAGRLNGFGGKVEKGESIEESVSREVFEEAGIEIKECEKVGIIDFKFEDDTSDLQMHIFRADSFLGEPEESEEMIPEWFDIDKIPFNRMWPTDKDWLPLLLAGKKMIGSFILDRPSTAGYTSKIIFQTLKEYKNKYKNIV